MDRLERKVDDGFSSLRSEFRSDLRLLLGIQLTMYLTIILGFAAILVQRSA